MKRMINTIPVVTAAALLIIGLACRNGNGDATVAQRPTPVQTAQVRRVQGMIPVRTSGRLQSASQMKLSFKIGGIIDKIHVNDGARVRKGDVLASLRLEEIDGQLTLAKAGLSKARRDYQRVSNLHADSVATLEQLQNAKTALEVAEAQLNIAQFNHDHAMIKAPATGRILTRLAEPHEMVGAGQPIFALASETAAWEIKAGVTDVDVVKLALGDSATVTLDAFPGKLFSAVLKEIGGAPDPMNGTYPVAVSFNESDVTLRSGFIGRIQIYPQSACNCTVIPIEALVEAHDRSAFAFTITADSTAQKLPIVIDYLDGGDVFISSGLDHVDHVIARGAAYLSEGTSVRITKDSEGQ